MKELYYRVVLYDGDRLLPVRFDTWQQADDFIFKMNIHAYITIL